MDGILSIFCNKLTSLKMNIEKVTGPEHLISNFTIKYPTGFVQVSPGRVLLPEYVCKSTDNLSEFKVHKDDIWVITYPKTGTTWTQEMLWCIVNDLDFEGAKENLLKRVPFIEVEALVPPMQKERDPSQPPDCIFDSIRYVTEMPSPRLIKTHFPFSLLPRNFDEVKPKVIYVARNPKDVCVSYFHHCKLLEGYTGSFEEFVDLFINDLAMFSPFWAHVLGFWERRDDPNVLFLKFEDLKKDLPSAIREVANFVGKPLDDSAVSRLVDHLSFENMKNNPAVNYEGLIAALSEQNVKKQEEDGSFIRKGIVGDWKNKMTPEMVDRFDKWTEENVKGSGLTF